MHFLIIIIVPNTVRNLLPNFRLCLNQGNFSIIVINYSSYIDKDKVESLVINFKNEIESQFGQSRKSNYNGYYFRPKVQTHIHTLYSDQKYGPNIISLRNIEAIC